MANCLESAVPPVSLHINNITEEIDLSHVPSCCHDLKTVLSKSKAGALPPHRPYDCSIAMENYIQEALSSRHMRPSSSVGAGFFFVEKKDKTLRPCIVYRELNQITVKDKYSLPLISSVFFPFMKHVFSLNWIFTMLIIWFVLRREMNSRLHSKHHWDIWNIF